MRAWVRKSFKAIPLVLLALVLTACGPFSKSAKHLSDPVPSSSAGTSPASVPSSAGTSPAPSPNTTGTGWACVTSSPTGTCPGAHDYTTGSTNSNGYNTYLAKTTAGATRTASRPSARTVSVDWRVTANEPAGNGSVRTAPEGQQQFNNWCPGGKTWSNLVTSGCGSLEDTPMLPLS